MNVRKFFIENLGKDDLFSIQRHRQAVYANRCRTESGYRHSENTKKKSSNSNKKRWQEMSPEKLKEEQARCAELMVKYCKPKCQCPDAKIKRVETRRNNGTPWEKPGASDKRVATRINTDGYKHSDNAKKTMRKAAIKRIEEHCGQLTPSYNSRACQYFNQLMEQTGTYIQHAENGGEYFIPELIYWLDGYDEENNIVYEWDERHHFNHDGTLKKRDVIRQKEIEEFLGCKFIRFNQNESE